MRNTLFIFSIIFFVACGETPKEEQIAELQTKIKQTEIDLKKLQAELKILKGGKVEVADFNKLISTIPAKIGTFQTYIEMPGKVVSRQNLMVGPDISGQITALYVTNGQMVQAGQVIAKIDDEIYRRNIDELENMLELAKDLFERQKNLWDQKVGSELQYLQAKNNKENLEKKLATARVQLSKSSVKAPVSGVMDEVFSKLGEMAGPGAPIGRLVNLNDIYIEAEVSESYVGKVKKGDRILIDFPSLNEKRESTVQAITQIINPGNRTFKIEAKISNSNGLLKPNLLATVKLNDYSAANRILVPTKLVQISGGGSYILVVDSAKVVRKKPISVGKSYDGITEILSGLDGTEELIDLGFRDVVEGDKVEIQNEI
jgi:RND family efflux transporter MFP subunit